MKKSPRNDCHSLWCVIISTQNLTQTLKGDGCFINIDVGLLIDTVLKSIQPRRRSNVRSASPWQSGMSN